MTSGPVIVMIVEGKDAVRRFTALKGKTDPGEAAINTLRKFTGLMLNIMLSIVLIVSLVRKRRLLYFLVSISVLLKKMRASYVGVCLMLKLDKYFSCNICTCVRSVSREPLLLIMSCVNVRRFCESSCVAMIFLISSLET